MEGTSRVLLKEGGPWNSGWVEDVVQPAPLQFLEPQEPGP